MSSQFDVLPRPEPLRPSEDGLSPAIWVVVALVMLVVVYLLLDHTRTRKLRRIMEERRHVARRSWQEEQANREDDRSG
jgi:hypothetical protein